jgi:hypothetical protein
MAPSKRIVTPDEQRLAEWAIVFPPDAGLLPEGNGSLYDWPVHAEWLASLEGALHDLRKTGRPFPTTHRLYVVTHVRDLLTELGGVEP